MRWSNFFYSRTMLYILDAWDTFLLVKGIGVNWICIGVIIIIVRAFWCVLIFLSHDVCRMRSGCTLWGMKSGSISGPIRTVSTIYTSVLMSPRIIWTTNRVGGDNALLFHFSRSGQAQIYKSVDFWRTTEPAVCGLGLFHVAWVKRANRDGSHGSLLVVIEVLGVPNNSHVQFLVKFQRLMEVNAPGLPF